ncbi:MAG TPA: hypothetical protein VKR43_03605 [Bryobacteraceae bacterium]|nr:hypothetical protein [Bryobacteraceae bacterium]
MRCALIFVLSIACAAAQFVTPVPSVMPAWLTPYPGAAAQNRQIINTVESSYTIAAPPHDILSHFRTLFASAGLPFQPDAMGHGFLIRAAAPECDLDISIRRRDPDTMVKVTCSPRLAVNDRIIKQQAQERAEHAQSDPMKKFDTPVYPQPKAAVAPLSWPSWLVRVDGARLPVEKFPGRLKSSFLSQPTREGIQAFYADLLTSHGFRVTQGLAAVPEKFGSWVQGSANPDDQLGRRVVIWVKIRPSGQDFAVELSLQ